MKINIEEVMGLYRIYDKIKTMKLPIKTGYKLAMFFNEAEKHQNFYLKSLNEIITEYSKKDENGEMIREGDNIIIQEDKLEECQKKLSELGSLEIELDKIDLTIDEFGDIELEMDDVMILSKFIKG